jgi:two-component system response regulator AtoC
MAIDKVLIILDPKQDPHSLSEPLRRKGIEPVLARNGLEGKDLIQTQSFELIFCEVALSDISGLELLKTAKKENPHTLVILLANFYSLSLAMEGMRLGALTYLLKPFTSATLETVLEKAREQIELIQENHFLRQEISSSPHMRKNRIIAESTVMKQILSDVAKVAKSSASVFISGESGTGKEVIAEAIHMMSTRAQNAFIKVNCAAIPETLIESEFFGHEKGSFTGAINKRIGRFELADQGTLLLDEISEVPLTVQSKLLRAVQEQEFERVGGIKPIHVDVRLVSTSNRNMKEAVDQKLFREDLYYRLNVVPIHLAPLRERKEDILPLAEYFLERLCLENQKPKKELSSAAQKKLLEYAWPGNIRELTNIIERAVVLQNAAVISEEDLFLEQTPVKSAHYLGPLTLEEVEKRHILETLALHNQNRTQTAKVLGISIRTLRNKLHAYTNPQK